MRWLAPVLAYGSIVGVLILLAVGNKSFFNCYILMIYFETQYLFVGSLGSFIVSTSNGQDVNLKNIETLAGFIFAILFIILSLIIYYLRHKIRLAVQLIIEATK